MLVESNYTKKGAYYARWFFQKKKFGAIQLTGWGEGSGKLYYGKPCPVCMQCAYAAAAICNSMPTCHTAVSECRPTILLQVQSVLTTLRAHRLCVLWSSSYEHVLICDAHYVCCIVSVSLWIIGKCQCGDNRALIPWTIKQFSPHTCNDYTCMQKCSIAEWPLMLEILATCILCQCILKLEFQRTHTLCALTEMHFQSTATAHVCSNLHCSCWHSALQLLAFCTARSVYPSSLMEAEPLQHVYKNSNSI